jgi:hypothetical protein
MKNKIFTIVAIVVILGASIYAMTYTPAQAPSLGVLVENPITDSDLPVEGTIYELTTSSSVYYEAQKKWFSQPVEVVRGTNKNVIGRIGINDQSLVDLEIQIFPRAFTTGVSQRDGFVQNLFVGTMYVNADNLTLGSLTDIDTTVPLEVSINEVTYAIPFHITGTLNDTTLTAQGTAELNMENFSIIPPTAVDIFTIDPIITVGFDITAVQPAE